MKIKKVICSKAKTGFYFDDQKAIKAGVERDGFNYIGKVKTPGFTAIRQAGEAISIQLILEDGSIAYGDCAAVQYSGAGGRDPLFLAEDFIKILKSEIVPKLEGRKVDSFKDSAKFIEELRPEGKKLHTALAYGLSQALLQAAAVSQKIMPCDVVAKEYGLKLVKKEIPIFTQSGDNRHENVDKMIIKRVEVMPHALINNLEEKLGTPDGQILIEYVEWLSNRIKTLAKDEVLNGSYNPILHIDVYGTIGELFGYNNYEKMAEYLHLLDQAASPFRLRIEGPMDAGGREEQMEALKGLREELDKQMISVEIVADEWCNTLEDVKYFADNKAGHMIQIKTPDLGSIANTIEAVLYCKEKGIGAYQGGTCNETDISARNCTQIAMATQPDQILAKPGMGVDEGYMLVYNEMQRILAYHE